MVKIAPSILKADFTQMEKVISKLENGGSDYIHLDVMDGCFVETITFGPKMVKDIRRITKLPLDAHLMVVNPKKHIKQFADAGADIITIHQEAVTDLRECLTNIKNMGVKCSVSIKPETPVSAVYDVLDIVDMVLVMMVEPGKGGQKLIPECLDKVSELKHIRQKKDYKFEIQADGGINTETKDAVVKAGVDIIVVGSAITDNDDYKKAIAELKEIR